MQIQLKYNLPFVNITVEYNGTSLLIPSVLIDTGSASTLLSVDLLFSLGVKPEANDLIHTIRGVGGTEVVFRKKLQSLHLDSHVVEDFIIEVGSVDYGFEINGILGMDFLLQTDIIIDLNKCQIYK